MTVVKSIRYQVVFVHHYILTMIVFIVRGCVMIINNNNDDKGFVGISGDNYSASAFSIQSLTFYNCG